MKISHLVFFICLCFGNLLRSKYKTPLPFRNPKVTKNLLFIVQKLYQSKLGQGLGTVEKFTGKDLIYFIFKHLKEKDLENLGLFSASYLAQDTKEAGILFWDRIFDRWNERKTFVAKIIDKILEKKEFCTILKSIFSFLSVEHKMIIIKSLHEEPFSRLLKAIYEHEELYFAVLDEIHQAKDIETFYFFFRNRKQQINGVSLLAKYSNFIPAPFANILEQPSIQFTQEQIEQILPVVEEKMKNFFNENSQQNENEILKLKIFLSVLPPLSLYEFFSLLCNRDYSNKELSKIHFVITLVDWNCCFDWKIEETWIFLSAFIKNWFIWNFQQLSPLLKSISQSDLGKFTADELKMISDQIQHAKLGYP